MKKGSLVAIATYLIIAVGILFIETPYVLAKNVKSVSNKKQAERVNNNIKSSAEVLADIDKYQAKYFEIIKRNDVFLQEEDTPALKNDRKELKKLFKDVKKQVKNKANLKKYNEIEKRYSKCEEETTVGMNEFAKNNYEEVDKLLNAVYKEVQTKISNDDFKKLTKSEKKWLKEVNNYQKVFDSKGFGTIGTIIYYNYEINMRQFRTLLLMLYL